MSFGKLYTWAGNARSNHLLFLAKENNLDIEIVNVEAGKWTEDYLKLNPLAQVPTFQSSNGLVITETIAIAVYFASQNEKTTLLAKSKEDYALILKWASLANTAFLPKLGAWFRPLIGKDPYNKKAVEQAQEGVQKVVRIFENHLASRTFFVGERLTLADVFVAAMAARGFEFVFDASFRSKFPNFTRWYDLIVNQPSWVAALGEQKYIAEAVKYTPPKKEPKPAAPKAEKKEAAPKPQPEEEEAKPVEKAKHPLELLGKAQLVLDDWKRKYSNSDTRTEALPWFWEHYNPEEWSLWKVDYKYNDELTQVFMSSNLVGGLFARLEGSRKYIFGSMSVYGESNNSIITGAFLVRGDKHEPAFDVAPDWESYAFTKLDPAKAEDKEFVESAWSWDKPHAGKPWADGKVFK